MQTIVSYDAVRALMPGHGHMDDLPETVRSLNQQRRPEDMVKAMPARQFDRGEIDAEQRRLRDALQHMRESDVKRVMNWSGLASPFSPRNQRR